MSLPFRDRPTNPVTELAKHRNRGAAQRTLLAWVQNCLSLIGIGMTLDALSLFAQTGERDRAMLEWVPMTGMGAALVGFGLGLLGLAISDYRAAMRAIHQRGTLPRSRAVVLLRPAIAIVVFGLVALLVIGLSLTDYTPSLIEAPIEAPPSPSP